MMKFEDILDDASKYLRNEMSHEERQTFESLLETHHHLKEELRFMKLVSLGLEESEKKEEDHLIDVKNPISTKSNWRRIFAAFAIISLLLFLIYWLSSPKSKFLPLESPLFYHVDHVNRVSIDKSTDTDELSIIKQLGGDESRVNADLGYGIKWTPSGEILFTAVFAGEISFGDTSFFSKGKRDILFGKFDLEKGVQWLSSLGGTQTEDFAFDISSDQQGNLLITGGIGDSVNFGKGKIRTIGKDNKGDHDFFIAKYDANSQLQWMDHNGGLIEANKQLGTNSGQTVITDKWDNVITSGVYIGSPTYGGKKLPLGGPGGDVYLIKYNPQGDLIWVNYITCDYIVQGNGLDVDGEANIFVTGSFGHHNLSGQAFFGDSSFILNSYGGRDIFLAKYNPNGKLLWAEQAGSSVNKNGNDVASSIAIDKQGNCIIAGRIVGEANFGGLKLSPLGGRDIFLAKYNSDGQILWVKNAGSPLGSMANLEQANAIAVDEEGNIYVTGSFSGTSEFDEISLSTSGAYNFFLAKYTAQGEVLWVNKFEELRGFRQAHGADIDIHKNGNIAITGSFSGNIHLAGQNFSSKGSGDIFILIFNQKGEVLFFNRLVKFS